MSRRTPTILLVLVVAVVVGGVVYLVTRSTSTSTSPPATTPTTGALPTGGTGFLHTSGTSIVDSAGQVVQLTGLNVQGMENQNPQGSDVPGQCNDSWKPLTAGEVQEIASYGYNAVRLPIAWGNLEPTPPTVSSDGSLVHHWNAPYVAALANEIQMLGAAHIDVILDMHQSTWSPAFTTPATSKKPSCPGEGMPVWLNPNAANETPQRAACAFYQGRTEAGVPGTAWGDFAAAESYIDGYFAEDSTVVGQDIVNEPYCGKPVDLNGFYAEVAPAVQQANPHILIIVEDKDDPGSFELTQLPPVTNIVLSIHLHEDYWSAPTAGQLPLPYTGQQALEANVERSQQWDVPLYVGEFYAFDGTGNQSGGKQPDVDWVADTASFVSYCRDNGISWTFWAWTQKKNPETQPEFTPSVQNALRQS